ncbi:MAG: histidine phosphatase family protein [Actinomycetota bacterium]|nr:histidine phosphatase family protein [Actinomycetota bacterium]
MKETRILLVRHPETEANVTGRWVGRGNAPLTAVGHEQVPRLVGEIVRFEPDAIWSSPLGRTLAVAEEAARTVGLELTIDERLTELDFGDAEGLTYEEAVERGIPFEFKCEDHPVAPGGESRRDILRRTDEVLADAMASSSRIAVVTHGGVFRSALVILLGLPIAGIWAFDIRNAQVAEVRVVDGHGMLVRFLQG